MNNKNYYERINRQRPYRYSFIRRHQNNIIFAVFTMVLVVTCAIMISGFGSESEASKGQNYEKYYMSYEVQTGDTLWSIAQIYTVNCNQDITSYINEIISSNHLNDSTIQSGTFLIIPYYMEIEL